jgi:hypothetical protein
MKTMGPLGGHITVAFTILYTTGLPDSVVWPGEARSECDVPFSMLLGTT